MKRRTLMTVILSILAVVVLLAVVLVVKTATYPFAGNDDSPGFTGPVDVSVSEKSLQRFAGGIQIPTIGQENYTDVDFEQFDRFKAYLPEVYPGVFEEMEYHEVNGYGMVLHWKGGDASREPILFLSHYDVVPVDGYTDSEYQAQEPVYLPVDNPMGQLEDFSKEWEYPPFSGAVAKGRIYGRGTLDMKCMLFSVLEAADALLDEGFVPDQDIWFAFGEDEENGGREGALRIAAWFKEQGMHFAAVYDEGGIVAAPGLGGIDTSVALVGVAEKGFANITLKVRGMGGHSSMPPMRSSLVQAAEIIQKLNENQLPLRLIDPVSQFLDNVGGYMSYPSRLAIANKWLMQGILLKTLGKQAPTNALARTTTAVTQAKGSEAANVLSAVSEITVNFRILPGETVEDVVRHVEKICEGYDVELVYDRPREPSKISPSDARGFEVIREALADLYPGVVVSSYITIGGTDSYKYEIVSDNVYRFLPIYLNEYEQQTIHNDNEHITISNFGRMISYYTYIMRNYGK